MSYTYTISGYRVSFNRDENPFLLAISPAIDQIEPIDLNFNGLLYIIDATI